MYNREAFERAMSVVLAHAAYLPSAACFALLPLAAQVLRTGDESGALLDYDLQRERVTICATRPYRWVVESGLFLFLLSGFEPLSLDTVTIS